MGLRISRDEETHETEIGGTVFTVKRCHRSTALRLRTKHSKMGRVDQDAVTGEMLETHVVGWRDLFDADGEPIPWRADLVKDVLLKLPDVVSGLLLVAIQEPAMKAGEALGNSKPS